MIQAGVATSSSILTLFDYQNNERLRVRGDGNVGIGTTSPGAALEVVGGGLGARLVSINTTALEVQGGANAQDIARFKNSVGNAKFVIDTNGNVGIGTTSPDANLHIFEGSAGTFTPAASYDEFLIESDGNAGMTIASPDNRVGGIAFGTPSDSNGAYIQWNFTGSLMSIGTAKNNSDLRFVTSNNTEAVRINSSGNVGIGTTSPSVKLHVDSASVETIAYFRSTDNRGRISIADNDTTTYVISEGSKMSLGSNASLNAGNLTIDSSGKVGIGTISPSYALDVEGSLNNIAKLTSSATKSQLLFADSNTTDTVVLGSNGDNFNIRVDNGNINFQTNSGATATTRMLVNSSGQVGIGTTSPNAVLSVHNTTSTLGSRVASFYHNNGTENPFIEINSLSNGMQLKAGFTTGIAGQFDILTGGGGSFVTLSPGSSEKMRITSTGNVGIGTTSPTSKLDVAGGDIELDDVAAGIIMRSPDGTKYRITVANGGTLTVTAV